MRSVLCMVVAVLFLNAVAHCQTAKAQLGTITDSTATVEQILSNPVVQLVLPAGKTEYKISSFDLTVHFKNGDVFSFSTQNGDALTDAAIVQIKKLQKGDSLFFDKIKATSPNSDKPVHFPSFKVVIR